MRILIILLAAVAVLVLLTAWFLAGFTMTGKRQTIDEAMQWQSDHYDTSFYRDLAKTDYTVAGEGGYVLHVQFLKNPKPSDRYIIISHGYTDNRIGSLKYAGMYLEMGFNCILYDLRGHGQNESAATTYGILEGQDLANLVQDSRERYPDMKILGLHGESLGAASTISSLRYKPEVDFVVADCGFSDIDNVLRDGYRNAHVPTILVDLADLGAGIRYHYRLKNMRPIDSLDDNEIPILFIHGETDSFILPKNSEDMSGRTKGYSELHLFAGACHAESVLTAPEAYFGYVSGFLKHLE
jgi:fermentation-respiration switch protein FrsA (DUF1100 family)